MSMAGNPATTANNWFGHAGMRARLAARIARAPSGRLAVTTF